MLTYTTSNLFDTPAQTLVNTVNTVGVMGKGIAAVFKQLYPAMYQQYHHACQQGLLDIGKLYVYRTPNKIIVNLPTKKHWREKSRVEYIEAGLKKFVGHYSDYGIANVSFPQLGCGHGELRWETQVQPIMERYLKRLPIPVYIHIYAKTSGFVPERLDSAYAHQIQLERQRLSADQVWQDLKRIITSQALQGDLFGSVIESTDERILLQLTTGELISIYREELEDWWNILRLRGMLRENDLPIPLQETHLTHWLFDKLLQLDYVQPIELQVAGIPQSVRALRYAPLPSTQLLPQTELVA